MITHLKQVSSQPCSWHSDLRGRVGRSLHPCRGSSAGTGALIFEKPAWSHPQPCNCCSGGLRRLLINSTEGRGVPSPNNQTVTLCKSTRRTPSPRRDTVSNRFKFSSRSAAAMSTSVVRRDLICGNALMAPACSSELGPRSYCPVCVARATPTDRSRTTRRNPTTSRRTRRWSSSGTPVS